MSTLRDNLQVRCGLCYSRRMRKRFEQRTTAAFYGAGRSCRQEQYIYVGQVE